MVDPGQHFREHVMLQAPGFDIRIGKPNSRDWGGAALHSHSTGVSQVSVNNPAVSTPPQELGIGREAFTVQTRIPVQLPGNQPARETSWMA